MKAIEIIRKVNARSYDINANGNCRRAIEQVIEEVEGETESTFKAFRYTAMQHSYGAALRIHGYELAEASIDHQLLTVFNVWLENHVEADVLVTKLENKIQEIITEADDINEVKAALMAAKAGHRFLGKLAAVLKYHFTPEN